MHQSVYRRWVGRNADAQSSLVDALDKQLLFPGPAAPLREHVSGRIGTHVHPNFFLRHSWRHMKTLTNLLTAGAMVLTSFPALSDQQGVYPDRVVIGAFSSLTGPLASVGSAAKDSMTLALQEINAAGGINGRKIEFVFEDDGNSPARAVGTVKKLIEVDKVFMIASFGGSNATAGAVDSVVGSKIVMYASVASLPKITWPFSRYLFRGATTESARYGELNAEFLTSYYKAKKIALITSRDEAGRNDGDATTTKLTEWFGVKPVIRVEFNIGDKDFTSQLVQVQQASPDVIYMSAYPIEAAIAIRQARELGLQQPIMVSAGPVDPSLIAAGKEATEGVIGFSLVPYLPGSKNPAMVKWESNWKKALPKAPPGRPNNFDLFAYADTYVIADAMKRAGRDLTTESFIAALESTRDYKVGPIATPRTFTNWHHIGNLNLVPLIVKNGAWEPLNWQPSHESDILKRYK
jgi:branched-chain amino acid transport system substrate-binding protein